MTKAEAIKAAARALREAWDLSDAGAVDGGLLDDLDAALALPDEPAPAPSERERALVEAARAVPECRQCGAPAVCELHYSAGGHDPHCRSCADEAHDTCREIAEHEMEYFGGAYGVPSVSEGPLALEPPDAVIERVNATHPPTDAAAAERAAIVAELLEDARKRARKAALAMQAHEGTSLPETRPHLLAMAGDHAVAIAALDAAADRIAARGPAPVWTKAGSPEHVALWDAIAAFAQHPPESTSVAKQKAVVGVEQALDAIIARVRAT